eukprot:TRINITY_DN35015_c0_g1_i1.p1 TRINITY_DN35015_c0_g1~~TRINITY_DN35015_c0_g1_i1.p1  ORF type:complete len:112 (-),score=26.65 TRINITY_DN35015_c0_g1_i1:52-387(-)
MKEGTSKNHTHEATKESGMDLQEQEDTVGPDDNSNVLNNEDIPGKSEEYSTEDLSEENDYDDYDDEDYDDEEMMKKMKQNMMMRDTFGVKRLKILLRGQSNVITSLSLATS